MRASTLLGTFLMLPLLANADTFVINGAKVHTVGPQGTLSSASIVIEDGMIREVGSNVEVPAGASIIDASGKIITPGLFAPIGAIGVTEVSAVEGTVDYIQRGHQFAASFELADAFNPRSTLIAINRIEGITRAGITPSGSSPDEHGNVSHVISGLGAIVHLGGADEPVMKRHGMLVVQVGERGARLAGGSRATALLQLKTAFDDALDYGSNRDAYDSGNRREYSVSRSDLEALQDVLSGEIPLLAFADRASDIRHLVAMAKDYGLKLIIVGGAEAWLVAEELAASNTPVVLSAVNNLPGTFDQLNARLDSAALLAEAGVNVSFGVNRNMITHNARNITQAAGIAVANGLVWEQALRSITLTPAELYGVADRVGSIEPGKEADLVIWPDDPLELTSFPEKVFIRGQQIPMESRQTLLRDRYLDSENELPPAYRR